VLYKAQLYVIAYIFGLVFYNKGLLIGLVLYLMYKYIPKSKQVNVTIFNLVTN